MITILVKVYELIILVAFTLTKITYNEAFRHIRKRIIGGCITR